MVKKPSSFCESETLKAIEWRTPETRKPTGSDPQADRNRWVLNLPGTCESEPRGSSLYMPSDRAKFSWCRSQTMVALKVFPEAFDLLIAERILEQTPGRP